MNVNFEFLGSEPIENVITCMNYQLDKVIYFGYHETIEKYKACTEKYLKEYCGVQKVVFHPLSHEDLHSVLNSMRKEIEYEKGQKNRIYFDITGGEDLLLVAFGMLAHEYRLPMHMYDVKKNRMIELDNGRHDPMDEDVPRRETRLDLHKMIAMVGGTINTKRQKNMKSAGAAENAEDIESLWKISTKYADCWNSFSEFLHSQFSPDEHLRAYRKAIYVLEALYSSSSSLNDITKLRHMLEDLADADIIRELICNEDFIEFRFKNETLKEILWDAGSILELHVYQEEKQLSDDCGAGVHLDWDGVVRYPYETDVQNEIDVLSVRGNIPTFISCKSGRLSAAQTLHALYELQTVAERFGGSYAQKVLVVRNDIGVTYTERAREMGITVRKI